MKKFSHLGKSLSRDEMKKIVGGDFTVPDVRSCGCSCANGKAVICNDCDSSDCFNAVYEACDGQPAVGCSG